MARLSKADRLRVLQRDAPELLGLLRELQRSAVQVRQRVLPAARELQRQGAGHSVGAAYLEAKQQLLLAYVAHISFFLLLRAEGQPVRTHPVMARLVQLRSLLDRLRAVDERMKADIDRLLLAGATALGQGAGPGRQQAGSGAGARAGAGGAGGAEDDDLRPSLGSLVPHGGSAGQGAGVDSDAASSGDEAPAAAGKSGVYKPMKRVAVPFEEGGASARNERRQKRREDELRKSELLQEMREAVSSRPEEMAQGGESAASRRLRELEEAREAYEDEHFGQAAESKADRKLRKRLEREAQKVDILGGLGDLDELNKVLGGARGEEDGGEDAVEEEELLVRGGKKRGRATLQERRERMRARDGRRGGGDSEDDDEDEEAMGGMGRGRATSSSRQQGSLADEDGDMMAAAQAIARARKRRKKEEAQEARLARKEAVAGTLGADERAGPRGITREIMKNKGLTKYRRKDERNPRVKYRKKAEKAVRKRKSQVPEMRTGERDRYAGETTGIRIGIQRSHKLD